MTGDVASEKLANMQEQQQSADNAADWPSGKHAKSTPEKPTGCFPVCRR